MTANTSKLSGFRVAQLKAAMFFGTIFFILIITFPTFAQNNKPQWWFTYNHQGRFSERWSYGFDLNHRTNGLVPFNSSLSAARVGMNYHTHSGFRFTAGYAWFGTLVPDYDERWLHENRLYEQVQYNHKSGKVNIVHRIRIEQRWREMFTEISSDDTKVFFTNRSRYLIQLDGPLNKKDDKKTEIRWQAANEFFIHNQEDIGYSIFDQNRTLAGVLLIPSSTLSVAVLYQFIVQQQPYLREIRTINSFRITLFHQLDSRKRKTAIPVEIRVID